MSRIVTRRDFALASGTALLGLAGASPLESQVAPRNWAWVHGNARRTPAEWARQFRRLKAAGFHGVHVGGGDTATLSTAARGEGLVFSRWIWILNRSGDEFVKQNHPGWFTVSREGKSSLTDPPYVPYYQWLCPSRPEVRAYLAQRMLEAARDRYIQEVHFDYIRHCDVILPVALWPRYNIVQHSELPPYDFCYCTVCRDLFAEQTGKDPTRLTDPAEDAEWRRFRWDSVTGLVRDLADAVHSAGKPATAAVFPTPVIARRLVRQAWDEWPLDAVFPMLYQGFYNEDIVWIGNGVREGRNAIPPERPLYAGLYLPDLTPGDLGEASRAAIAAGAAGIAVFEMDGLTAQHLAAVPR